MAPQQKVTFNLTYQELLQRALGVYQNMIFINPGQIVSDLKVDVFIDESKEITKLRVPALQKDVQDTFNSFEGRVGKNGQAYFHYTPRPIESDIILVSMLLKWACPLPVLSLVCDTAQHAAQSDA